MIRALLFDLDGTLTDSAGIVNRAAVKVLNDFGYDVSQEALQRGQGQPFDQTIAPFVLREQIPEIKRAYYDYYSQVANEVTLFPGVRENIPKLSQKYLMGIVTGKIERGAHETLDMLALKPFFQVVVGGDTTQRGKPWPDPVLYALDKLGAVPQETIFIGDSIHDINAAKNAGVISAAVLTGAATLEEISQLQPHYIFPTIDDFFRNPFL